jgi:hypothetical protein
MNTAASIAPNNAEREPTLLRMVSCNLVVRGYGGLYNTAGDCACRIGDLFPCGAPSADCTAGYLHRQPPGCEHDFLVTANRAPPLDDTEEGAGP